MGFLLRSVSSPGTQVLHPSAIWRTTMATTNLMIQFEVQVDLFGVTVPDVYENALLFLDGKKRIVVRELAVQKLGGIAYATLKLILPRPGDEKDREEAFYAPSFVPSPGIDGAGLAMLEVWYSASQRIGVHAYLDEIDIP
jgi:hypothetical protein